MIGFVILNYSTFEETIVCVKSIKANLKSGDYTIVIVDNASPDDSWEKLKTEYEGDEKVLVIHSDDNLGFAKGNNLGIQFLSNNSDCNFICVMNSDTYLLDEKFYWQIIEDYHKYDFWVLGPNIHTPNGHNSNPIGNHVLTKKECKKKLLSLRIQLILNYFFLDERIRKLIRNNKASVQKYDCNRYYENIMLHGSCLVFSRKYIDKYKGFNPGTFLYLEEDLLYAVMMKDKNKTLYSPNVNIFHSEDAATDKIVGGVKKRRFILKNHIKSMKAIYIFLSTCE